MVIGILSKLKGNGGSEHRCVELCNAIGRYTPHDAILLGESGINNAVRRRLDAAVPALSDLFQVPGPDRDVIYNCDRILVVNTDSQNLTDPNYWVGKFDFKRLPPLTFLFNWTLDPAARLLDFSAATGVNPRLIVANNEMLARLRSDPKFIPLSNLTRTMLQSPIDPKSVSPRKTASDRVRVGKHSMPSGFKFCDQTAEIMETVVGNSLAFDFMGVPDKQEEQLKELALRRVDLPITVRKAFTLPVGQYLSDLDIFWFNVSFSHHEPWSRSVAEAMMSGCPVIAPAAGGNRDQVRPGENGILVENAADTAVALRELAENQTLCLAMGKRSMELSREFASDQLIHAYVDYLI